MKAHEHDVQEAETDLALLALFVALEELRAIGGQIVLQQVREIELRQKLNYSFLARRFIGKPIQALLPGLLDRPVRLQPRHKFVSGWSQPKNTDC